MDATGIGRNRAPSLRSGCGFVNQRGKCAQSSGRGLRIATQDARHVALVVEAAFRGNIRQRHLRVEQQIAGAIGASPLEILTGRDAGHFAEDARQVHAGLSRGMGQALPERSGLLSRFIPALAPRPAARVWHSP